MPRPTGSTVLSVYLEAALVGKSGWLHESKTKGSEESGKRRHVLTVTWQKVFKSAKAAQKRQHNHCKQLMMILRFLGGHSPVRQFIVF